MSQAFMTRARTQNILKLLRPFSVEGLEKVRVGKAFDGGYVMINDFFKIECAYSLGINEDVSWDIDIANRGIPVIQYDHTIDKLPQEHSLFRWYRLGISDRSNDESSLTTIPLAIEANEHVGKKMLLKCDIEGSEWSVFADLQHSTLCQFTQIVIELHQLEMLADIGFSEIMRRAIVNLTNNHVVVHVHGNNFTPWTVLGGIPLPTTLELTLVNRSRYRVVNTQEIFPGLLDMPNNWQSPDCFLGQFDFG